MDALDSFDAGSSERGHGAVRLALVVPHRQDQALRSLARASCHSSGSALVLQLDPLPPMGIRRSTLRNRVASAVGRLLGHCPCRLFGCWHCVRPASVFWPQWRGLTVHSGRSRFAARLNSCVRPHMALAVTDQEFDSVVSLRDAYRIMERFASEYLARGDTSISDFLRSYAGEVIGGQTTDPAAAYDFLAAADQVLTKQRAGGK